MARHINHNHSDLGKLEIFQYKNPKQLVKEGNIERDGKFKIKPVSSPYYLELRIPKEKRCTVDWGRSFELEKTTIKDSEEDPNKLRLIYKVHNLEENHTDSDKDDDVDVTDPDDEPIVE